MPRSEPRAGRVGAKAITQRRDEHGERTPFGFDLGTREAGRSLWISSGVLEVNEAAESEDLALVLRRFLPKRERDPELGALCNMWSPCAGQAARP